MMTVKNLGNIGFVGAQRGENHLALRLMTDKQTGKHRSFGFCEYHGTDAAQRAVSNLNGAEINGRHLKVAACNNGGMLAALLSHPTDLHTGVPTVPSTYPLLFAAACVCYKVLAAIYLASFHWGTKPDLLVMQIHGTRIKHQLHKL